MRLEQAAPTHLLRILYLESRDGDKPSMEFHSTFVCLLNGKGKRVVARVAVESAGQANVPRLYFARIDDRTADSCLQDNGVDTASLQLIENLTKFFLLSFSVCRISSLCLWPVQTHYGCKPYCTYLMLWCRRGRHEKGPLCHPLQGNFLLALRQVIAFLMQVLCLCFYAENGSYKAYNNIKCVFHAAKI